MVGVCVVFNRLCCKCNPVDDKLEQLTWIWQIVIFYDTVRDRWQDIGSENRTRLLNKNKQKNPHVWKLCESVNVDLTSSWSSCSHDDIIITRVSSTFITSVLSIKWLHINRSICQISIQFLGAVKLVNSSSIILCFVHLFSVLFIHTVSTLSNL